MHLVIRCNLLVLVLSITARSNARSECRISGTVVVCKRNTSPSIGAKLFQRSLSLAPPVSPRMNCHFSGSKIVCSKLPIVGGEPKSRRREVIIPSSLMPVGRQGAAGLPGPPGMKGERGFPGRQGKQGDDGEKGYIGEMGPPGSIGPKGDEGDVGPIGSQGLPGMPGNCDATDYKLSGNCAAGEGGTQGPKGAEGRRGYPGDFGEEGENGDTGQTGNPGPTGPSGMIGPHGSLQMDGPCYTRSTDWVRPVGSPLGKLKTNCSNKEFLQSFEVQKKRANIRYVFKCCPFLSESM